MTYATIDKADLVEGQRYVDRDSLGTVMRMGNYTWGGRGSADKAILVPDEHEPWMIYEVLDARLHDRKGKPVFSRKVANNTYLERAVSGGGIAVRLHETDILTFWPNGNVRFYTGGWGTVTTKERMHRFLPYEYERYIARLGSCDEPQHRRHWELVTNDTSTLLYEAMVFNLATEALVDEGSGAPIMSHAKGDHPDPDWGISRYGF